MRFIETLEKHGANDGESPLFFCQYDGLLRAESSLPSRFRFCEMHPCLSLLTHRFLNRSSHIQGNWIL